MKAAVYTGNQTIEVQDRQGLTPGKGEVLVEVRACGVCGTDQHIYHGMPGSAAVVPPRVLGHELSGVIASVGEGVQSLQPGARVTIDPNIYCRSCVYCRSGRYHLCNHLQAVGVTRDGGMAQYCVVPAGNAYILPDALSYEEGAMIEPLGCVIHGIHQLEIRPGASVLIIGGGYIGQMMLQMVKLYGASPIIVSEPDERKRDMAYNLGADEAYDPFVSEALEQRLQVLGGGADIVIECVGRKESMEQAVRSAGKGGQVLLFGVAAPSASIQVSPFEIFAKELTIRGSFINPHTHDEAISLVQQGIIQIKPLISHRFDLAEVPNMMREFPKLKVTKAIILPRGK